MNAPHKRDFATNDRLPRIALLAAVIGVLSTLAAFVLLSLIHLFTNLFFFQRFSFADHSPAGNALGAWAIAVPVIGGLIVGMMARFGSEKIRGHGIPEAIEAILFGKSRMSPKVAVLKPLSSGVVIGSGGPFGAEGPIIMTGGALGTPIADVLADRAPVVALAHETCRLVATRLAVHGLGSVYIRNAHALPRERPLARRATLRIWTYSQGAQRGE
ncbi:chloride channel protein, partial [Burkholderia ubonensis]|uniref:chloride channel protein n=1 Tax=Burkholderia ubonensis TaxID=101571 RepID=UPI002155C000